METVVISGTLIKGPLGAGDCSFPGGTTQIPFTGVPSQKPAAASFTAAKQIESPTVFVGLDGVGTGQTVTQGNLLYLRSINPFQIRLTMQDTVDIVSIIHVHGLVILEFPTTNYLKLLEAKGSGTLEYVVSGNV